MKVSRQFDKTGFSPIKILNIWFRKDAVKMYFFIKEKANERENAIVSYSTTQLTSPVLWQGGDLNLLLLVTTVCQVLESRTKTLSLVSGYKYIINSIYLDFYAKTNILLLFFFFKSSSLTNWSKKEKSPLAIVFWFSGQFCVKMNWLNKNCKGGHCRVHFRYCTAWAKLFSLITKVCIYFSVLWFSSYLY